MSDELPLTLSQIAELIPGARGARRISPATLTRWILAGSKSRAGEVVRLKATRAGCRWLVYQRDLDAFFAALNPVDAAQQTPPRSPAERNRAAEQAGKELEAMGC